ncbi:MAG: hypothetical protein IPL22_14540 [Bacteroidetes bacterium]|nr:hypothetical protein [Bacteroidota bacterium]
MRYYKLVSMINLKIKTLFGLYGLILISGFIQSCCHEDLRITSQGRMNAWELYQSANGIGRKEISIIKGDFILSAIFKDELVINNNFSLLSASYALSCSETWVNSIDSTSMSVSIDKEIILNSDTIPAHRNLLTLSNSGITLHNLALGGVEFRFTKSFFSNATMENGEYNFTFNGKTTDNIILETNKNLSVEL